MLGGNIMGQTNKMSLEIYNAVFNGDMPARSSSRDCSALPPCWCSCCCAAAGGRFSADATPSRWQRLKLRKLLRGPYTDHIPAHCSKPPPNLDQESTG